MSAPVSAADEPAKTTPLDDMGEESTSHDSQTRNDDEEQKGVPQGGSSRRISGIYPLIDSPPWVHLVGRKGEW